MGEPVCRFCAFGFPAELACTECGAEYCRAGCTDTSRLRYSNMICPDCRPAFLAKLESGP